MFFTNTIQRELPSGIQQNLASPFLGHQLLTAHYAFWHVGQQQRIFSLVCSGQVFGWCWYSMCSQVFISSTVLHHVLFGLPLSHVQSRAVTLLSSASVNYSLPSSSTFFPILSRLHPILGHTLDLSAFQLYLDTNLPFQSIKTCLLQFIQEKLSS